MIRVLKPVLIFLILFMFWYRTNTKYHRIDKIINKSNKISNNLSIKNDIWLILSWLNFTWSYNVSNSWEILSNKTTSWSIVFIDLNNLSWSKLSTWIIINMLVAETTWIKKDSINAKISSCVFHDKNISNWSYVTAYRQKYTNNCEYEKRYCKDGTLDGSYIYDTCIYGNMNNNNGNLTVSNENKQNSDKSDNTSNIKNNNKTPNWIVAKSNLVDDYDNVGLYIDEFVNNYPIVSFKWKKTSASSSDIKKILDDRKANVDLTMTDNRTTTPKSLEQYVDMMIKTNDNNNKWNKTTTQPKYDDKSIKEKPNNWCLTPRWTIINNGQSIIAYSSPASTFPKSCDFETRYCNNWKLDGNYSYQNCEFGQLSYQTKFDANSYYIYSDNSSIYYPNYLWKSIWSNFYLLNTNNIQSNNTIKKWCWMDNVYIPDSESKPFYKTSLTLRWSYCNSIFRKCNDGVLWWDISYDKFYCRQSDPISCRAPWYNMYIPHWDSKVYYNKSNTWYCSMDYRYCNNWILGGSFTWITSCFIK